MRGQEYLEFSFTITPVQPAADILAAQLGEAGFESFEEQEDGLLAYIDAVDYKEDLLHGIGILNQEGISVTYTCKTIKQQNWNANWESDFHPIEVDHQCRVRAPFHEAKGLPYEILIEPKMSFGTGHHETTHMMMQFLLEEDLEGKRVLDMGCGTGVLAILAGMKGAKVIDAIDIDSWSYENARENVLLNKQGHIRVMQGDAELVKGNSYDLIIANINKNVLLQDIPVYADALEQGGVLLLSGFYQEDLEDLTEKCSSLYLIYQKSIVKNNWVSAKYVFSKKNQVT